MKPDLYTKAVLTVIALALTLIACNQYVTPKTTAQAQGGFSSLLYDGNDWSFFDSRTGEIWKYYNDGSVREAYRLNKLGQPLTVLKKKE